MQDLIEVIPSSATSLSLCSQTDPQPHSHPHGPPSLSFWQLNCTVSSDLENLVWWTKEIGEIAVVFVIMTKELNSLVPGKNSWLVEPILKSFHLTNEGDNWTGVAMASSLMVPSEFPISWSICFSLFLSTTFPFLTSNWYLPFLSKLLLFLSFPCYTFPYGIDA